MTVDGNLAGIASRGGSERCVKVALISPDFIFIGPMCTWGPIIGSPFSLSIYETFLKPCEDLVKTVNVVNVVKT